MQVTHPLVRQLGAILALPFMAAVVIPLAIARVWGIGWIAPATVPATLAVAGGAASLGAGLVLFAACVVRFATQGRGTLAPWDPPTTLVLHGAYRHVRNPMISGVMFVLLGEAAVLRSLPHALWVVLFVAANALYIPLVEEPQLERRFGSSYRRYRSNVPRFVPRLRPWRAADDPS